jgi:MSHA biogenesis protein MshG
MGYHSDTFPPLAINMVRVGENTGRLDEAFLQLAEYLERDRETRDQVKMALRYPAFVIFAIGVAIAIINYWVIPTFARVFKNMGAELPWQTKILIALSDFTVAYWPLIIATLLVATFALRTYVRTEEGRYRWDKYKLRLPIVGDIIYRATLSRFSRAFAMASHAGVPIIQTLTVVSRAVDNSYIGDRILSMRNGVERGDNLTRTAAATGMFTPLVIQMINVGEETGAVDEMMTEVADFYDREIAYDIKNLSAAIEPILLVFIGIMVLVLWDLGSVALNK